MRKEQIKNFTIEVLDFLLGIPEAFAKGFDRDEFYRQLRGMPSEKVLTTANICKIFHQFKKTGYIEIENTDSNESIKFTNKAKLAVIDKLAKKEKTGKENCFISFDIPEKLKSNRDKFRRAIKRIGFVQIQKSLWSSNKNVGHLVDLAAEEYKVESYVVYIISKQTNIDDIIPNLLERNKEN